MNPNNTLTSHLTKYLKMEEIQVRVRLQDGRGQLVNLNAKEVLAAGGFQAPFF